MEDHYNEHQEHQYHEEPRRQSSVHALWLVVLRAFERVYDFVGENLRIMVREKELFLGTALSLIGFLSFESDKFCDGNTADYLSCTRPSTYYYFDTLDTTLIVVGVMLMLVWYVKRRARD